MAPLSASRRTIFGVSAAASVLMSSPEAAAQSLLQRLFGNADVPNEAVVVPVPAYSPFPAAQPERKHSTQKYRTVCVRLCDGFYFPISHGVTRSAFDRDTDICRSRCNQDARLYYMPADAGIDRAVSLDGISYGRLATAYAYRKTLMAGCACRPDPWSQAERSRHASYAVGSTPEAASEAAVEAPKPPARKLATARPASPPRRSVEPPPPPVTGVQVARGMFSATAPAKSLDVVPAKGLFGNL